MDVERKTSEVDLVTEIDRETQRRIVAAIREAFPGDEIVSEEGDERETVSEEGYAWIIDPIDGTQNYTRGTRAWVTSVAVVEDGRPVASVNAAPALGNTYVANEGSVRRDGDAVAVNETADPAASLIASTLRLRDEESVIAEFGELRRTESAQLTLSMVADGALDATVGLSDAPNSWDTVAGIGSGGRRPPKHRFPSLGRRFADVAAPVVRGDADARQGEVDSDEERVVHFPNLFPPPASKLRSPRPSGAIRSAESNSVDRSASNLTGPKRNRRPTRWM
ncbi:inositol monophosphatase family protein [Halogeometricum sp. S1BR25-6]|uniref:fructose-bisphosphatase n=1 Tax=Halogeometricum salsisoli TaxID=2950536 RepID=A0ABU2GLC6_9EURY|nr:inositol monophosphatase family protein [Halogeometricum sp. S1BR25-6]